MIPMTVEEMCDLLELVEREHNPLHSYDNKEFSKHVKYVIPYIDMRTNSCYAVTFRGFGWEKTFSACENELPHCRLEEVVRGWLAMPVNRRSGEDRRSFKPSEYDGNDDRETPERRRPLVQQIKAREED